MDSDRKLKYAQKAEELVNNGILSPVARLILDELRQKLKITPQEASLLEQEVLEPFLEYQKKLQTYEKAYQQTIALSNPRENFDDSELKQLQTILGLQTEDIVSIEMKFKPANVESLKNSEQSENHHQNTNTVSRHLSKVTDNPPLNVDFINSCRKELAMFLGPMASFILEDVLAKFPHLTEQQLIEKLAQEIPNQQQATEFLAKFK